MQIWFRRVTESIHDERHTNSTHVDVYICVCGMILCVTSYKHTLKHTSTWTKAHLNSHWNTLIQFMAHKNGLYSHCIVLLSNNKAWFDVFMTWWRKWIQQVHSPLNQSTIVNQSVIGFIYIYIWNWVQLSTPLFEKCE